MVSPLLIPRRVPPLIQDPAQQGIGYGSSQGISPTTGVWRLTNHPLRTSSRLAQWPAACSGAAPVAILKARCAKTRLGPLTARPFHAAVSDPERILRVGDGTQIR